jgi:hypothetical protein
VCITSCRFVSAVSVQSCVPVSFIFWHRLKSVTACSKDRLRITSVQILPNDGCMFFVTFCSGRLTAIRLWRYHSHRPFPAPGSPCCPMRSSEQATFLPGSWPSSYHISEAGILYIPHISQSREWRVQYNYSFTPSFVSSDPHLKCWLVQDCSFDAQNEKFPFCRKS